MVGVAAFYGIGVYTGVLTALQALGTTALVITGLGAMVGSVLVVRALSAGIRAAYNGYREVSNEVTKEHVLEELEDMGLGLSAEVTLFSQTYEKHQGHSDVQFKILEEAQATKEALEKALNTQDPNNPQLKVRFKDVGPQEVLTQFRSSMQQYAAPGTWPVSSATPGAPTLQPTHFETIRI